MEEKGLSRELAEVLRDRRERYNAAFAQARHRRPALSGPLFLEHLRLRLDPIVAALPQEGRASTCDALYDLSLELMGCDLFARFPLVAEAWESWLPRLAPFLPGQPRKLAASLTNALVNLCEHPGARPAWWLERMRSVGAPDAETLLAVGQVLAWRAGLPHYREGALALCERLDSRWTGVSGDLDRLRQDPWLTVEEPERGQRPRVVFRVGGFRGFGGPFVAPPQARHAGHNRFFVSDGEGWWLLVADGYGTSLHRLAEEPAEVPEAGPCGPGEARGSHTLATTRPLSHYLLLSAL